MLPSVHVVHQTRTRLRLRIPEKRKDLRYFLGLYEELRAIPGVTDVVVNPDTGSVLLHFPSEFGGPVVGSMHRIGLLRLVAEGREGPGRRGQFERFFAGGRGGPVAARTVLLSIMIGLAIHQVRRGTSLVPVLSVLWYAYDFVVALRKTPELPEAATGASVLGQK